MTSNERRLEIITIIKTLGHPIKGSELAKKLNVSRQVVVQDIALLRVSGYDIIATPQGYIMYQKNSEVECIYCKNHKSTQELYDELKIIVDMGGTIKDVVVDHPIYGQIRAELNISSTRDINDFMEKVKKDEFKQLSTLTEYDHAHTIEASKKEIIDEIKKELNAKDILSQ